MYNKKGLSAIVATVLIVLLVIAGVTLVWTPIRKLITEQAGELEASCLMANPQIVKACTEGVVNVNLTLTLTISNGAEIKIDETQIIYGNNVNNLNNTIINPTSIEANAVKTIKVINASGTPDAVKIAAIIGEETCAAGSISTVAASC